MPCFHFFNLLRNQSEFILDHILESSGEFVFLHKNQLLYSNFPLKRKGVEHLIIDSGESISLSFEKKLIVTEANILSKYQLLNILRSRRGLPTDFYFSWYGLWSMPREFVMELCNTGILAYTYNDSYSLLDNVIKAVSVDSGGVDSCVSDIVMGFERNGGCLSDLQIISDMDKNKVLSLNQFLANRFGRIPGRFLSRAVREPFVRGQSFGVTELDGRLSMCSGASVKKLSSKEKDSLVYAQVVSVCGVYGQPFDIGIIVASTNRDFTIAALGVIREAVCFIGEIGAVEKRLLQLSELKETIRGVEKAHNLAI